MIFENACGCDVNYRILERAIIEECDRRNIKPKETYKIYLCGDYARISLKHDKVSVHRLIGKYMVGCDLNENVSVHHIDGNKLNNNISNLQVLRKELHTKEHNIVQYVNKEHLKNAGNRLKKHIERQDVTTEEILLLKEEGFTIKEIASKLKCGYNTVCRRLGMKDY